MKTRRTETICCRIPENVKRELIALSNQYDLSVSDIVVNFCRKGLLSLGVDVQEKSVKQLN